MRTILADREHPIRHRLEQTVRAVFLEQYGAHVPNFPKRLLATVDADGEPQAVAGLRFADDNLFSELYLDDAAERVLSGTLGHSVHRDEIVEFSSLVAKHAGAAMPLVEMAIHHCLVSGARFGLFTATARLRAMLRRRGILLVDLGPTRPDRLPDAAAWGRYFLHDPRVIAVAADTLPGNLNLSQSPPPVPRHA